MSKSELISVSSRPYTSLLKEIGISGKLFASKQLAFNMQSQTQTNWCWAATSTSVSHFYWIFSTWTQCKVANGELGHTDCCNSTVPSACNVPWYLDKALTRTNNFLNMVSGQATFQQVRDEIDAGRPVGARIGWSGGGGHFMVIYGYSLIGGNHYFDIDDPIYGKSHLSVADFSSNYQGSGTWTHTYFTKSYFKMPIKYWVLSDLILQRIWEARPLLNIKQDLTFDGDMHKTAEVERASLGMAHRVFTLDLDSLLGDKKPVSRPTSLRVYEMTGDTPRAFFDVSDDADPKLMQMSASKNQLELFSRSLDQALKVVDKSKAECELRLLRIPALNFEAVWINYDGNTKDFLVPLRDHEKLAAHKPIPFTEVLAALKKSAQSLGKMDDTIGS